MIYIVAAVLLYLYLIPGMYALNAIWNVALTGDPRSKDDLFWAIVWPMFFGIFLFFLVVVLLAAPFIAFFEGRDTLREWGKTK